MTAASRYLLTQDGWLESDAVRFVESPNADERPRDTSVDLIVIHNISLPPGQFLTGAVLQLFTNQLPAGAHPYYQQIHGLKVSAHFLIDRLGGVTQFVSTNRRAWHAGASMLEADGIQRERCNDFSIGIELEGCDDLPYSVLQYQALADVTQALLQRYPIQHVRGHDEIAPGRKTDPGPAFDWRRYAEAAGLGALMRPPAR